MNRHERRKSASNKYNMKVAKVSEEVKAQADERSQKIEQLRKRYAEAAMNAGDLAYRLRIMGRDLLNTQDLMEDLQKQHHALTQKLAEVESAPKEESDVVPQA